jgi:hypothetical protein
MHYAHPLPDDPKSANEAIDNQRIASIYSCYLHVEGEKKGAPAIETIGVPLLMNLELG